VRNRLYLDVFKSNFKRIKSYTCFINILCLFHVFKFKFERQFSG